MTNITNGVLWTEDQNNAILRMRKAYTHPDGRVNWAAARQSKDWAVASANGKRSKGAVTQRFYKIDRPSKSRTKRETHENNGTAPAATVNRMRFCPCCGADLQVYMVASTL